MSSVLSVVLFFKLLIEIQLHQALEVGDRQPQATACFGQRQPVYELGYATAIGVAMFIFTAFAVLVIGALTRRERVEF